MPNIDRVRNKEWGQVPTQPLVDIVAQLNLDEKQLLYFLAEQYWRGNGAIIDAGAFVGGSAKCFAMGVAANVRVPEQQKLGAIHSYGQFTYGPQHEYAAARFFPKGRPAFGTSIRYRFERQLGDLLRYSTVHEGDVTLERWNGTPIEILFLDIYKNIESNDHCTAIFFPNLVAGESILIQQDYIFRSPNIWIYITMELLSRHFDLLTTCRVNSAVWQCIKPITVEDATRALVAPLSHRQRIELALSAAKRSTGEARNRIEGSVDDYLTSLADGSLEGRLRAARPSRYHDTAYIRGLVQAGKHRDAVGGAWEEIGQLQLAFLIAQGLQPRHKVIDLGCGSLRGGVKLVEYLEEGNYYGTDLNRSLLDSGYDIEISKAGLTGKLPRSHLITDSSFDFSWCSERFDFALAHSLFTHLPLNEVRVCLERLHAVMAPGASLFATFFEIPETHPSSGSFRHAGGMVTHGAQDPFHYRLSDTEFCCRGLPWRAAYIGEWGHPRGQRMIQFIRVGWRCRHSRPARATCECYEGCSSGGGLGSWWLLTASDPSRGPG